MRWNVVVMANVITNAIFVLFLTSDWWTHPADGSGCVWHRSLCWVDPTQSKAWSNSAALWFGGGGPTDHLPSPAYTQPILPAGMRHTPCVSLSLSVYERNCRRRDIHHLLGSLILLDRHITWTQLPNGVKKGSHHKSDHLSCLSLLHCYIVLWTTL